MLNRVTPYVASAIAPVIVAATLAAAPAAVMAQGVPVPQVAAKSWMLYDVTSGQALAS